MKIRILLVIIALGTFSCAKKDDIILDVKEVANKTPEEVLEILGEPDSIFIQKVAYLEILTHLYKDKAEVEIQYPKGKSTDIIIRNPSLPFDESSLKAFNLEPTKPASSIPNGYMKWKKYSGFETINFYVVHLDQEGKIDNYRIFFKADTAIE